jgi:hypothetical protein
VHHRQRVAKVDKLLRGAGAGQLVQGRGAALAGPLGLGCVDGFGAVIALQKTDKRTFRGTAPELVKTSDTHLNNRLHCAALQDILLQIVLLVDAQLRNQMYRLLPHEVVLAQAGPQDGLEVAVAKEQVDIVRGAQAGHDQADGPQHVVDEGLRHRSGRYRTAVSITMLQHSVATGISCIRFSSIFFRTKRRTFYPTSFARRQTAV